MSRVPLSLPRTLNRLLLAAGLLFALPISIRQVNAQAEEPAGPMYATAGAEEPSFDPIRVAITLDDLPWVGPLPEGDSANDALVRIAATLRVHEAPATGFVVCDRAREDEQPVTSWAAWGLSLGNHSAAHRDLNQTPVEEWLRDVERCDRFLRRFGDATTPYFRFPLLHQGDTAEKRERARDALRGLGLETAHVTVDTSEWILTRAHAAALRTGDAALRRQVGEEFVRHILAAVEHADAVARRKVGRPVPQVLLLHANTLVDDRLDALLLGLRGHGVELISLERALADPVYARQDMYVGPKGLSWLYRIRPASAADVEWDDTEAANIQRRFAAALDGRTDPEVESSVSHLSLSPEAPRGLERILADAGATERMRSLLVMHKGKLLAEAYYHGAGPETSANLKSITKTLTSALVGVALRKGWIESVDDPVAKYIPERFRGGAPTAKAGITLRHLLTMSSGLAPVDYGTVQQSDDWVASVLGRPLDEAAQGETFAYDTPVLQLLTAVLEEAGGMPVGELAQRELLGPMDAELAYWRPDAQGIALGGNDAYLRPRDLIKLGELYRRGGEHAGRRLLAPEFVEASTAVQISPASPTANHDTLRVRGYGFLWWLLELGKDDVYAALGHGGQILLVSPSDELVVVLTSRWPGGSSTAHYRHMTRILVDRILPAFRVSGRAGDEAHPNGALNLLREMDGDEPPRLLRRLPVVRGSSDE